MNSDDNSKLHLLDNRLITVETQLRERKEIAERQHSEIMTELRDLRKDLSGMKTKNATVSALISAIITLIMPHR